MNIFYRKYPRIGCQGPERKKISPADYMKVKDIGCPAYTLLYRYHKPVVKEEEIFKGKIGT